MTLKMPWCLNDSKYALFYVKIKNIPDNFNRKIIRISANFHESAWWSLVDYFIFAVVILLRDNLVQLQSELEAQLVKILLTVPLKKGRGI